MHQDWPDHIFQCLQWAGNAEFVLLTTGLRSR